MNKIRVFKQSNDFKYITLEERKNDEVRAAIEYAGGHFEKPIESSEYREKYSLTKNELNKMISLGLIKTYAINGYDFLNDEKPRKETEKNQNYHLQFGRTKPHPFFGR